MTPSWPQLAGWMVTPTVRTVRCSWQEQEGRTLTSGTAVGDLHLDRWQVLDAAGRLVPHGGPQGLLQPEPFTRGDDYHRAAGPVTAAEHDGRRCWRVELVPPPHKHGLLSLLVDDTSGLCLQQRNVEHDVLLEVTALELDVPLPPDAFALADAAQAERDAEQELYRLVRRKPPPTPRWFPWRRGYLDAPGCWVVEGAEGSGIVARAPLGQAPELPEWEWEEQDLVRLDVGGWSWAVGAQPRLEEWEARGVVQQVVDGRPYD
jgi:hypothetical protein